MDQGSVKHFIKRYFLRECVFTLRYFILLFYFYFILFCERQVAYFTFAWMIENLHRHKSIVLIYSVFYSVVTPKLDKRPDTHHFCHAEFADNLFINDVLNSSRRCTPLPSKKHKKDYLCTDFILWPKHFGFIISPDHFSKWAVIRIMLV